MPNAVVRKSVRPHSSFMLSALLFPRSGPLPYVGRHACRNASVGSTPIARRAGT